MSTRRTNTGQTPDQVGTKFDAKRSAIYGEYYKAAHRYEFYFRTSTASIDFNTKNKIGILKPPYNFLLIIKTNWLFLHVAYFP